MHISKLLQTARLFSYFSQSELEIFEKAFSVNTYEDGHEFTKEGERNRTMFLIVEGDVEVTRHRPGIVGYDLIKKLGPGQVFGLASLLDNGYYTATCRTAGAVKVASLAREAFDFLVHNNASIARRFQVVVTKQLTRDIRLSEGDLAAMLESGNTNKIRRAAESRSMI